MAIYVPINLQSKQFLGISELFFKLAGPRLYVVQESSEYIQLRTPVFVGKDYPFDTKVGVHSYSEKFEKLQKNIQLCI